MKTLKNIFPLSFKWSKDVVGLIIGIVLYIVVAVLCGWAITLVGGIPVINILVPILGILLDVYCLVGLVLLVLAFLKVI